jgi:cold shock CspA family protein
VQADLRLPRTLEPHMSGESFYSPIRKRVVVTRTGRPPSAVPDLHGTLAFGRVTKLQVGQGHGYIRLENAREVFFHRADMRDGTSFNDLHVGADVIFELFEDPVSGARALRVARRRRSR